MTTAADGALQSYGPDDHWRAVEIEVRQDPRVDCWVATAPKIGMEFVGFSAKDAIEGIAKRIWVGHGRPIRVVHQDEERKGPARFQP